MTEVHARALRRAGQTARSASVGDGPACGRARQTSTPQSAARPPSPLASSRQAEHRCNCPCAASSARAQAPSRPQSAWRPLLAGASGSSGQGWALRWWIRQPHEEPLAPRAQKQAGQRPWHSLGMKERSQRRPQTNVVMGDPPTIRPALAARHVRRPPRHQFRRGRLQTTASRGRLALVNYSSAMNNTFTSRRGMPRPISSSRPPPVVTVTARIDWPAGATTRVATADRETVGHMIDIAAATRRR